MSDRIVRATRLTAQGFAPFGDVIETQDRPWRSINEGTCARFDDLARVDVAQAGGRPLISIFRANPRQLPMPVRSLERHPLSSQSFYPLDGRRYLVIVAEEGERPIAERIRAFMCSGQQGVNYRRNTWHHSLIALDQTSNFMVVDRGGPEENCEELSVDNEVLLVAEP